MVAVPKVAIVMPYYNEPDLLKRSVEGVMNQTYCTWKLFIVDDGSDKLNRADHNIIQNYQIKIINKPNSGVSDARNRALDHIQAEGGFSYIAYCDADDVWDKNHLQHSIIVLETKKADLVYTTPIFKMVDGSPAYPYGIPFYESFPGLEILKKQNFIYISSVLHRVECCRVGSFDGEVNSLEDWDMWLRIAKAGYIIKQNTLYPSSLTYTCKPSGNGSRRTEDIYKKILIKHAITNNTNS
jgi:glycosyltransferase involved in cell wall biosynthesis